MWALKSLNCSNKREELDPLGQPQFTALGLDYQLFKSEGKKKILREFKPLGRQKQLFILSNLSRKTPVS